MGFPERLKALRLEENLTQKDVSQAIGISQPAYTYWEKGEKTPTPDKLLALAKLFNVTTDYLLGNSGYRSVEEEELSEVEMLFRATSLDMSEEEKLIFKKELMEFMEERKKSFGK